MTHVVSGSYFLREPQGQEKSSVFHGHIDARTPDILERIVKNIETHSADFQNKIYPISHLHLGPQIKDPKFASVYKQLPNFHAIKDAQDEAFSTGKMGDDGFNYEQVEKTLDTAFTFTDQGVMTELEEDIYSKEFDKKGAIVHQMDRGNTPYAIDWSFLPGWKERQIGQVPRFELHHGFDIEKAADDKEPPIDLVELTRKTAKAGFQTGGWFIFRKNGQWAYRCNEFSNLRHKTCIQRLEKQAVRLREIIQNLMPQRSFTSTYSLEKVHAIWKV